MCRRRSLVGTMIVCTFALLVGACGWPMRGFDPAGTRSNPFERTISPTNISLSAVWTGAFGPGTGADDLAPIIANGVLYAASTDDKVYAFDAGGNGPCSGDPKTCLPLWTATTGGDISSSPAYANGNLYVAAGDGMYVFDANGSNGCSGAPKVCTPLWTAALPGSPFSPQSPTIANDVVYVTSGTQLLAFDAAGSTGCGGSPKTCAALWTSGGNAFPSSAPVVAGGVVYVGGSGLTLYAYDASAPAARCSGTPKRCAPLWRVQSQCSSVVACLFTTPAVSGGAVFVGAVEGDEFDRSGSLHAFDAATGAELWNADTYSVYESPAVAHGVVYVSDRFWSQDDETFEVIELGRLRAFNAADGAALWTADIGPSRASPAIANGVVFAVSSGLFGGDVFAFDATGPDSLCSGVPRLCFPMWHDRAPGPPLASPAVSGGHLYVAGVTHGVVAFSP